MSDREILCRYRQDHHNEWIGILFDRYVHLLFGMCMKYLKNEEDAKDGVQQIFLKVIDELGRHDIVYFKAWIYQVARNYCLMQLRSPRGRKSVELNEKALELKEDPAEEKAAIASDKMLDTMRTALEQLNEEQQACVRLFYLQKKSYQEIVHITGYTLLQVKSYIQNGKRNLRLMIEKMSHNNNQHGR